MPEYGWRTWEVRGRSLVAKGHGKASTCGGRVPHGPTSSLAACGTRAPHMGKAGLGLIFMDKNALLPFLLNLSNSLHLVFKKKNCEIPSRVSLQFSQLPNTITFSYEVRIEWFKLEIVRIQVLYHFQVILKLFDWFSEWSTQKTEPACEIKVVLISWWFHLFKPSICLGFLLLYVYVCLVKAIEKDSFTINLIEKSK